MAAAKPFSIGGVGAQASLDDVVRIALGHATVTIDTAGAERIKKLSPTPKQFQLEPAPAAAPAPADPHTTPHLSTPHARAAIAVKLLNLTTGRSGVRLQLCDFLAQLLNANVTPVLTPGGGGDGGDVAPLRQLADLCHGVGLVMTPAAAAPLPLPIAECVAGARLAAQPPGLSAAERAVVESGAAVSAGVAALTVQAARMLVACSTAVAALSVEAIGAQTKPYDAEALEAQGFKAATAVADEMRTLLEGSKRAGSLKGGEELPAFSLAPQRLGVLAAALSGAYQATRSEVQSEALAVKAGAPQPPSSLLLPTLVELGRSLLAQAQYCLLRTQRVLQGLPALDVADALQKVRRRVEAAKQGVAAAGAQLLAGGPDGAEPGCLGAATAAAEALEAAADAVALEALAAVAALRAAEGPAAAAAPEAAPEAKEDGGAGKPEEAGAGKPGGKDKEKKKKGGPAGMVLGKGTSVLRVLVEAAAELAVSADGGYAEGALTAAWRRCGALLQPLGAPCGRVLEEVRAVMEANQARRKPKIAKGARDFLPQQMAIREAAFASITAVMKRHGAVSIDTPVFELRETLTGKYGEDSKLIYDLADQGGEILSLRYDLTVPFARYVAVHSIVNIKRYHIGKVYRRDQPQMNRGRFREFFQCDFDIAGSYATMVADAEVLKVVVEILTDLRLGQFEVKLNHRGLLDAMLEIAGVPTQKFRAICSAIDKLDKEPWSAVRCEMIEDKGLPEAVADRIGEMVVLRGRPLELLEVLTAPGHPLAEHEGSRAALEELRVLFGFLQSMGALGPIVFDLSLARGLDYYTGVIYEAVLQGSNVGSIAAGGRYDKLVGMFSGKDVPSVGVSIGIERVFAIMEEQATERAKAAGAQVRATETQVLVASVGNGMQPKRMELASQLWAAGIKAEFGFKPNPKMGDQLNHAFETCIPFIVLFGEDEINKGVVKVKDIAAKTEDVVPAAELVQQLLQRLANAPASGLFAAPPQAALKEQPSQEAPKE